MKYLFVRWKHSSPDEPIEIYSELDEQRMERRKIEIYPDGRWGFADAHDEAGGCGLGEVPVPSIEQLNADPEYEATEVEKEGFERLWAARTKARVMTDFPMDNDDGMPS